MAIDLSAASTRLAAALLAPLRGGGAKARALAKAEAHKLAASIATIGELLASGQIDPDEAAVLLRIQRDASESVLASLAETSRIAVHRALSSGLEELVRSAGDTLGGAMRAAVLAA